MSETKQQEATTGVEPELEVTETSTDAPAVDSSDKTERGRRGDKRNQRRPRRGAGRPERVRPEFEQKLLASVV
ncbi:MAG: hypothetical protein UZ19_OD1000392 [Parcubacteria bacterium OLB19]|nr:MAG: hypothetical protein UZ19_OD1000392 [Parcubacteria bacterium OLB19]